MDQLPFLQLTLKQHLINLKYFIFGSFTSSLTFFLELYILTINLHLAGRYQDTNIMAGIGLGITLIHALGGCMVIGLNQGYSSLAGIQFGKKDYKQFQIYFHKQFFTLIFFFIPFIIVILFSYKICLLFGQEQRISYYSYLYALSLIPGLFCYYLFDFLRAYLNCMQIYNPVTLILLIISVQHTILSLSLQSFNFKGLIISTNISYFMLFLVTFLFVHIKKPLPQTWTIPKLSNLINYFQYIKITFPIALPLVIDMICFETMTIIIGSIKNTNQTIAHIAFTNIVSICYSIPFGIGNALCSIGSNYIGQGTKVKLKNLYVYTILLSILNSILFLIVFFNKYDTLFSIYTHSQQVKFYMKQALIIQASFVFCDYIQSTTNSFLKIFQESMYLLECYVIAFLIISTPLCIILGKVLKMGILGAWLSFGIGVLVLVIMINLFLYKLDWDQKIKELSDGTKCEWKMQYFQMSQVK